jgi:hypothetical protein
MAKTHPRPGNHAAVLPPMTPNEYKEIRYCLKTSSNTYLISTLTECRDLEKIMQRLDLSYNVTTIKRKDKEVFSADELGDFSIVRRGDLQRVNRVEETQRVRAKKTRERARIQ